MNTLSMCRICLAEDVKMYSINNTHLQGIYESLINSPLEHTDKRPIRACYICIARLQNCYSLKQTCVQSEETFTQMLCKDLLKKEPPISVPPTYGLRLRVTAVVNLSIGVPPQELRPDVKLEPAPVTPDVVIKKEVDDISQTSQVSHTEQHLTMDIVKDELDTDVLADNTSVVPPCPTNKGVQAKCKIEHSYNKKEHFVKLMKQIIEEDKPFYYQCRKCKKTFYQRNKLNNHTCANADKKPYKCDVCDQRFKLKCRLLLHIRKHSEHEPYHCNVCNKTFDKKYLLKYHIRAHSGEKPYECEVCEKRFITKSYLLKHIRMHRVDRPYECNTCHKTFKSKSNISEHIKLHNSEKSHKCDVCKKGFKCKGNLKKHVQIHTGERPHECEECGKRFINNSDLVKHRRTHTPSGQKPYQCEKCHETFNYNSNFLKHKRVRCRPGDVISSSSSQLVKNFSEGSRKYQY